MSLAFAVDASGLEAEDGGVSVLPFARVEIEVEIAEQLAGIRVGDGVHRYVFVPHLRVRELGEFQAQQLLVYVEQT